MNISNTTALSILRMSNGHSITTPPNSTDPAPALSYTGCVDYCGPGQESFSWTVFSQEFLAWLLPYLALLSQLPFGARHRTDNLMSAILTLGSPTLAGYSLFMTLLNARWANEQLFAGIDYPSTAVRQSVVQVLSRLQQVPVRINPGESARFESLVVHPDNDDWWTTLAAKLDYSRTWSIASATHITWVVIAYLLTVADSFSNVADNLGSTGQGTGSVWICFLPIVVGWLVLSPKCDYTRVLDAYDEANKQVFVADPRDPSADPTLVVSNFGLTISPNPDWELYDRNVISPDELRTPPVFNYARTLSWSRTTYVTSLYYRAAWRKMNHRVGVDGAHIPRNVHNHVPRESRLGNRDQIIQYCHPDDREYHGANVLWPRGVFFNMIVASLMSLQLQWGTTSAAVVIVWFTPTVGLGCRSLAYLVYGALSTAVWILLVSSSILGYYAHHLIIDGDLPTPDLENDRRRAPFLPPKCTPTACMKGNGSGISVGVDVAISLHEIQAPNVDAEEEDMFLNTTPDAPATITTIKYSRVGQTHHLANDLPTPQATQRTPSTSSKLPKCTPTTSTKGKCSRQGENGGKAIPLHQIHASNFHDTDSKEPASIRVATIKYPDAGPIRARTIAWVSDWLRWIGKSLAIVNAIGIIAISIFQYAGVYNTCYCDSSVFTWGSFAYNVIAPVSSDLDFVRSAWIGALALSFACCAFFVGTIYLVRDSLPS
ncbi:hypothetical protein J3R83DRAFT_3237 [Lanmaoa asiatica]|nr:hypothetical protein J3R83DRAFT_3237 [Lanmaoa asiatica]